MRRVLLPGLTLPVDDYAGLVDALDGDTVVLNTLVVPVTGVTARLRSFMVPQPPYELVGHSVGALAALEWAAAHPDEVTRVVLLDPSDPYGAPVPTALGGSSGRLLTALVRAMCRSRRITRALGRWGRRTVLNTYGVVDDPLPLSRVDALFGTREALAAVVAQVVGVPAQVARVRALLDAGFTPPDVVVIGSSEGATADSEATARLAERLGTTVVVVPGAHLFPMTHPTSTAAALR